VTPRFAANLSLLFTELPFRERAAAAAAAGFEGVEFWWPEEPLGDIPPGVEVVLMNFDGGDVAAGERGFLNDPARWRAHVPVAVELARSLGCMRMHALVGLDDGRPRAEQLASAAREVAFAARRAAPITVLVEAINTLDHGPYLIENTDQSVAFARAAGEPNVKLQYDVFHMTRMGEDVEAALRDTSMSSPTSRSPTIPGAGSPAAGRSTSRPCSRCSTSSATRVG
jgi:hydroxypyruvate isomerase